jgi:cytochrome c
MKRSLFITTIVGLIVLAGCEQKEDKIISPEAQAPQTAEETQQPARLDTAMKSSQESASAVDQSRMTSESGMKQATTAMTKQAEATVKAEAETATKVATASAEQNLTEQAKPVPVTKESATAATRPTTTETATTATKPVEAAMSGGGDAAKGAVLAKKRCSMCHNFDSTKRKVGPGLKGVYGRAPSITDVPFAKWDAAALDKWLTKPKAVKKNTKMAFPGFPNKADRDDVIAFLKTL